MDACVTFVVPSETRFLPVVRAAVHELGRAYGFGETDCRMLALAVDEALANVIRHAYGGDPAGEVEVQCLARPDRLEFMLLDEGTPPDPSRLMAPVDLMASGGRGTHIIRAVMDEVSYERAPRGNRLRLSKRLPATHGATGNGGKT